MAIFSDNTFNYFYNDIFIKEYGYSAIKLKQEFESWKLKRGDSTGSKRDFIWSTFNSFIDRIGNNATNERDLYQYQRKLTLDMIRFRHKEGAENKKLAHMWRLIHLYDLRIANLANYKKSVEIVSNACCENCVELSTRTYEIEYLLKEKLLPYKNCTRNSGCNCCYIFKGVEDNNGRLIMK